MDEALLGDLFEDFQSGRSSAWYWRQVLAAILVGFVREVRYRWVSTGFAIFWSYGFSLLFTRRLWPPPQAFRLLDPLYGWATRFDFPASFICMFFNLYCILVGVPKYIRATWTGTIPRSNEELYGAGILTWFIDCRICDFSRKSRPLADGFCLGILRAATASVVGTARYVDSNVFGICFFDGGGSV
jgi:hypothetical protein